MNERLLEPLICQKYPRNIQNTPNLYFNNFRCFRCILVILHVQGHFGHNLSFRGFYRSFFFLGFGVILVLGVFWSSYMFRGILVIIQVLGVFIDHFFQDLGLFWSFFLGFWDISIIFQVSRYFGNFFRFRGYFNYFLGFRGISVIFQIYGVFW